MDDEKQCMSDSLGFPVGQATQVIQLGRLKFLAHFAFKIRQSGLLSTGQPAVHWAAQGKDSHPNRKQRNAEWSYHWLGHWRAEKHK